MLDRLCTPGCAHCLPRCPPAAVGVGVGVAVAPRSPSSSPSSLQVALDHRKEGRGGEGEGGGGRPELCSSHIRRLWPSHSPWTRWAAFPHRRGHRRCTEPGAEGARRLARRPQSGEVRWLRRRSTLVPPMPTAGGRHSYGRDVKGQTEAGSRSRTGEQVRVSVLKSPRTSPCVGAQARADWFASRCARCARAWTCFRGSTTLGGR